MFQFKVIAQKRIPCAGPQNGIQMALSDGHNYFSRFIARGELPGRYSLIRIRPNTEKNEVVRMKSTTTDEEKLYVFLGDYVKILPGEHTRGGIGSPTRLQGSSTADLTIKNGGSAISRTEYADWLVTGRWRGDLME